MNYLSVINQILIIFLPISLIIGSGFVNSSVALISFIYIVISIYKKDFLLIKNKFFILFAFWCIYLIIISLFSDYVLLSLESSLFYIRFGFFVLAIYYANKINPNFIRIFFYVLITCYFILILDGLYQFVVGTNILGFPKDNLRISSFFGNELIYGSYLSRLFPLLLALIIFNIQNEKYSAFFFIIMTVSTSVLILLSGERVSFFMNIMSLFIIFLLIIKWKKIRIFTLIFLLLSFSIVIIFSDKVRYRMIELTNNQINLFGTDEQVYRAYNNNDEKNNKKRDKSSIFSLQHQVLYETSYKIFKDNIIIGIGPKNFREECKKEEYRTLSRYDGSINGCQTSPANIYIQLFVETGIIGTIPVLIFFFFVFFILIKAFYYKYFKRQKLITDVQICIFASLFVNLWPLIPSGNFFNGYISTIYYLPLGFLFYSYEINKDI